MNLLSIENLSKNYGEKILLNNISFNLDEKDKVGIIGINGTGKSTLLKIISGIETYDSGKIITSSNLSVEYLPQTVDFSEEATVLQQIFKTKSPLMKLISDYENTISRVEYEPENKQLQENIIYLSNKMDEANAWNIESKAKTVLTKLGIKNFGAKISTLSGGQKKRVALASVLINPSDLLILDEPTNHIDNETINWLEGYLNDRSGALIMITHDRYFLDRVTNRIVELHKGEIYNYYGNYSVYLNAKLEREQVIETKERKRQNMLKKELEWVKRGAKARTTKQKARIDRFEELSSQSIDIKKEKIDISLAGSPLGKKIIELKDVSKSLSNKALINNFNYIFTKEDKVGIVGPNGIGKSTLLNILVGKTKPDIGEVSIGETVRIGYFSQEYENINENIRVIEYIREGAEFIKSSDGTLISASKMLERFLFPPNLQYTYINRLSGGEKRRLYLLRVLMSSPNVLVLDEPTNDLDIETLNILEEYIDSFKGTVIAVSHDRFFLDKICNKLLVFKGEGKIEHFTGNYSDCKQFIELKEEWDDNKDKSFKKENNSKTLENKTLKFSYKEKIEYEQIENVIEKLEEELEKINDLIELSGSDYIALEKLISEKEKIQGELEFSMDRWAYLNELAEKISNQS